MIKSKTLILLVLALFLLFSCSSGEEKSDVYYFSALQKIEEGHVEEAVPLLEKGIKNSSPDVSKLCSLFLSEINKKKAVEILENALKQFPDDNAVNCRYMAVLYETGKYDSLISFSEQKKELLAKDNEYLKYRLLAFAKTGDTRFSKEFTEWFTDAKFTSYHREFLDDWYKDSSYNEYKLYNAQSFKTFEKIINTRQYVNSSNYSKAYKEFLSATETEEEIATLLTECSVPVLSDVGKAFLYGSTNKAEEARIFSKAGMQADTNEKKQMLFFYAGRLLGRSGAAYRNTALENFRTAYSLAEDDASRDNALWYYLETSRQISIEKAVSALDELASSWTDASYFDDFLDDLLADILYSKGYSLLCAVFERNKVYFSKAAHSKYAYVVARIIEEELCESPNGAKQLYINSLLQESWELSEANLYYRILLADKLGKTEEDFYSAENETLVPNESSEELIARYFLEYNLYQQFYAYFKMNSKEISEKVSVELIEELKQAEKDNKDKYADILRLGSNRLSDSELFYRKDIIKTIYPRFFEEKITEKSAEYMLPEYFLYSLIRTESYFDDDVYSSAGAIGLCQLMEQTAADVAKKLKVTDYDLLDADTNMTFGAYYLGELIRRLDNNSMSAFLSYNCGITRVRKWKEEFNNLPGDLFLEVIPIEETREYGKKILTAACLYGNLYYEKPFSVVLDELFFRFAQMDKGQEDK